MYIKTPDQKRLVYVVMLLGTYAAIKITAIVCATILALRVHWALGAALFVGALLVRFEFRYIGEPEPPAPEATP